MQAGTFNSLTISLAAVLSFAVFWCALCLLIGFITGWFSLGRRFKRHSGPYGETKVAGPFFYTIHMRWWSHYGGVIRLTAAGDALYATVLFPFRVGHPPLRIPWDEIQFSRTTNFFRPYVVLTLGNQEKIPMRISIRMARNLGILDRCPV